MNILMESLWADEAYSALVMRSSFGEMVGLLLNNMHHVPFYYFLGFVWGRIFGFSEISLRSMSLLFLLVGMIFVFLLVKHITKNKSLAVLTGVLVFFVPFVNYYGFEARMYTLLILLSLASTYFFITKKIVFYAVSSVLLLYTHYFGVLFILGQFCWYLIEKLNKRNTKPFVGIRPFVVLAILFAPWFYVFVTQRLAIPDSTWLSTPSLSDVRRVLEILLTGNPTQLLRSISSGLVVLALLAVDWKNLPRKVVALWVIFFSPVFSSFILSFIIEPIFYERYLITLAAGFAVLLAISIKRRYVFLLVLLTILNGYLSVNQFFSQFRPETREAVNYVLQNLKPEDKVIYCGVISNNLFVGRYYGLEAPIYTKETIPYFLSESMIRPQDVISKPPMTTGRLFVMTSDNFLDCDISDLMIDDVKHFFGVSVVSGRYIENMTKN